MGLAGVILGMAIFRLLINTAGFRVVTVINSPARGKLLWTVNLASVW